MRAHPLLAVLAALLAAVLAACGSTEVSVTSPDAPKCQVQVAGGMASAPAAGATGEITIDTTRDCTWAASTSAAWIALTSATTGQGAGTVSYRVDANGQPAPRSAAISVNGSQVAVSQQAAPCTFTVSPSSTSVAASGGSITLTVSTLSGCPWTSASDASWVHVGAGASGNGNGTVRLTIDPNAGATRTAAVRIGDQTVSITQQAAAATSPLPAPQPTPSPTPTPQPCHYSVAATAQTVPPAGATNSVQVTADEGCAWTAKSNVEWITITRGASGTGDGMVTYTAEPNAGPARTGTLTIAGSTVTVTQTVDTCTYSLSSSMQNVDAAGGTGSVAVTTASACPWTATSNAPWITVTSGASGTGNGIVGFSVAVNSGGARSGTLTIGGETFTVLQAAGGAPPCNYSISPARLDVAAAGGSGSTTVTTGSGCTWTAVSNAAWITITSGATGTGSGPVAFTVAANTGAARTGTLTVAGQTFTVSQAAAAAPPPTCTYTIAPTSESVPSTASTGSVTVTTASGCAWTAVSNASWITVTSGASGSGSGTVGFSVDANSGKKASNRSGTITIAGETFTVNQAGNP